MQKLRERVLNAQKKDGMAEKLNQFQKSFNKKYLDLYGGQQK